NTQASGTFVAKAFSGPDVSPTSNAHFDDIVLFRTLPDLVRNAGLSARDWPDTAGTAFDRPTVAGVLNVDPTAVGGDIGVSTLDFAAFTVSGFRNGAASNISFDEPGGTGGLGIFAGTSNLMSSATNDVLRFELVSKFRRFALTLNH